MTAGKVGRGNAKRRQSWVDPHRLGEENLNVVLLGLALTHATWTKRNLTNERVFEKTQTLRRGETEHNGFGVKLVAKSLDGEKMKQ